MVRANIKYSGKVQGVGFRFTIQRIATNLQLTGWVKNLPDGSVEAIAQGPKEKIVELCVRVEQHFKDYIRDKKLSFTDDTEQLTDFQIRF